MLHELVRYAESAGLDTEAGFRPKQIRWVFLFHPDGKFLGVVPYGGGEKKGATAPKCPHLQFSGDSELRQFLVDTVEYLALFASKDKDEDKLRRKHRFALALLKECSAILELAAVSAALSEADTINAIRERLKTSKAKPSDNATIGVDYPDGERRIFVQESCWHDWWRERLSILNRKEKGKKEKAVRCLVSGNLSKPLPTHPKIRGLTDVGGLIESSLVSFNEPAFCSYGLEQSANAPVSSAAANAYAVALNHLIETQSERLGGVKVVYWYAGVDQKPVLLPENEDPLRFLNHLPGLYAEPEEEALPTGEKRGRKRKKDSEETDKKIDEARSAAARTAARDFLRGVINGERGNLANYRYYSLMLSGSQARVMVRDFSTGRFGDLCGSINAWFDDLEITHRSPWHGGLAPTPKFISVLASMVRELKDIISSSSVKLWQCAVNHAQIPDSFAVQALNRMRADIAAGEVANHARMGLLKAFLVRLGDTKMEQYLNEGHPDPEYHCGRLLAVLEEVQRTALGEVGAGVIQRYYGAASTTPALVLGRLTHLANVGHLPKLETTRQEYFRYKLAGIWAKIPTLPETLSLRGQTLFAMGYYQQKAKPSQKKED